MTETDKALLKIMVEQAEISFNRFNCQNYPNDWLVAHQVMLRFATLVMKLIPDLTNKYFSAVDDCTSGNPHSSEKFIKCSKEYIQAFKSWLDTHPTESTT